ncbi:MULTISPECIES: Ycf34 family protein [unclassified Leptolyngbya]|uniref:Ycf34 family protein n=1 Tax=unclassified Leptolyngbya TaxID=2650499 RepID=UPI003D319C19
MNCQFVDRCTTYHQVEANHRELHRTQTPDFQPRRPQIKVYRQTQQMGFDVVNCGSFQEKISNV